MRWDRFFEDLEDQLDSEWEAERAALDTEAERLRLSRVPLRDRLIAVEREERSVTAHLVDGTGIPGRVLRVGADWFAVLHGEHAGIPGASIVPLSAVEAVSAPGDVVLRSVRDAEAGSALGRRMAFGFVVRDLVRRRIGVAVRLAGGRTAVGTIDRAGADHLDLALHDAGTPRRAENVSGYRIVPFAAIIAVSVTSAADLA